MSRLSRSGDGGSNGGRGGEGRGFSQDKGWHRLHLEPETSCKYMQKTMQINPAGGQWEEDPAGDFVSVVWPRATCNRITWGTYPSPPPPPNPLLPPSGAAAQESTCLRSSPGDYLLLNSFIKHAHNVL